MSKLAIAALSIGVLMCGTSVFAADESTTSSTKTTESVQTTKEIKKTKKESKKGKEKREVSDAVTGPLAY